jgi:Condensation domain
MTFPASAAGRFGVLVDDDRVGWPLRVVDLRDATPGERADRQATALRELHATFAPQEYPLCRGLLLRDDDGWLLALAVDHLVFDGGSVPVFLADFARVYRAMSAGAPVGTGGSDVAGFSAYERTWLDSAAADDAFAYWRDVWADFGPFPRTALPVVTGPVSGTADGVCRTVLCGRSVRERRQRLSTGHVSLPAFAKAALLTALRDLTGQRENGLLHPSSRRFVPGADTMIGYLNNRVLLRVDTPPAAGLPEILARTRSALLDSLEHHMMPFEVLLDRLAPELRASRPDRPYVHLNVERRPTPPTLPGLHVSFCWPAAEGSHHDLPWISVDLDDGGPELLLTAAYSRACFADATVAELTSRIAFHLTGTADERG